MKSPKIALYVTGGLVFVMGLWGLLVTMGWLGATADVVDPWWHAVAKLVVGAWALYVATTVKE